MVGGPPSSEDKQRIKDDAELIKHHKYGGRIFILVKVVSAQLKKDTAKRLKALWEVLQLHKPDQSPLL